MGRLPEPYLPWEQLNEQERLQHLDARLWHSRSLEICCFCEADDALEDWEGGLICPRCRRQVEAALAGDAVEEDPGWW